jgi:hypothetical protein
MNYWLSSTSGSRVFKQRDTRGPALRYVPAPTTSKPSAVSALVLTEFSFSANAGDTWTHPPNRLLA